MGIESLKFWIHPDGWIYTGDEIEGARPATEDEITEHLNSNKENADG